MTVTDQASPRCGLPEKPSVAALQRAWLAAAGVPLRLRLPSRLLPLRSKPTLKAVAWPTAMLLPVAVAVKPAPRFQICWASALAMSARPSPPLVVMLAGGCPPSFSVHTSPACTVPLRARPSVTCWKLTVPASLADTTPLLTTVAAVTTGCCRSNQKPLASWISNSPAACALAVTL